MGAGRAVNRSFSGQCLHGHQSNRGRRGFHCACTQVGTPALATDPGLVATLVYPASSIVPLNARSRTIPVTPAGWHTLQACVSPGLGILQTDWDLCEPSDR